MENLRDLLAPMDPNHKTYMGHALRSRSGGTWMSGGAGYVLSRATFEEFIGSYIRPERGKLGVSTRILLEVRALSNNFSNLTEHLNQGKAARGLRPGIVPFTTQCFLHSWSGQEEQTSLYPNQTGSSAKRKIGAGKLKYQSIS